VLAGGAWARPNTEIHNPNVYKHVTEITEEEDLEGRPIESRKKKKIKKIK
jgi:hypothetical protein